MSSSENGISLYPTRLNGLDTPSGTGMLDDLNGNTPGMHRFRKYRHATGSP
jgi:hypothetical protein